MKHSYSNARKNLITVSHVSNICSAVEQEFISGISKNDVSTRPESFPICQISIGKNLSSLSLLPSVANRNQCAATISSFMSFITFFATTPVRICEVLVRPHLHLLAICESGTIDLKSLNIWSAVASGRLFPLKIQKKVLHLLLLASLNVWPKMTSILSISFVLLWHHNTPCVLG